jgi:hypothetical protein
MPYRFCSSTHGNTIPLNDGKELGSCLGIAFEASPDRRCRCQSSRLLDSPHDHAKVRALHDYGDTEGFDRFHNSVGNLACQSFLYLQALGVQFGNPGELGQTENLAVGNVSNMDATGKRDHVVFAQTMNVNVADHYHFGVIFVKDCAVGDVFRAFVVALAHVE